MSERVFMKADEVAEMCGLNRNTVYKLARLNQIPHTRAGRVVRFHRSAIEAWLKGEWRPDKAVSQQREQATA